MVDSVSTIKVAPPEAFDGNALKFRDWHRQLLIYIRGKRIEANDDKILLTLSYMKTGTAATWANRFFDVHAADLGTWAEFEIQLKAAFEDKTLSRKAREKLENLHQGSSRIDDFISRFESLAKDAAVEDHDTELIRLLERNVKADLIDSIYSTGDVPTTFNNYKSRVLKLGRLWEQRQEQKNQEHRRHAPSLLSTAKPSPTHPVMPPSHSADRRTPTGVVFGGRGKPMDIDALRRDNRCFTCGVAGHFRRECPDKDKGKKVNIRSMVFDLSKEEQDELLDALMKRDVEDSGEDKEPAVDKDFQ